MTISPMRFWLCVVAVTLVFFVFAPRQSRASGAEWLHDRYTELEPELHRNVYGVPIYLAADDHDSMMRAEVYGVLSQPFARFSSTLGQLSAWCELSILHFSIKGCTHRGNEQAGWLTLYSGSKYYQDPRQARKNEFVFALQASTPEYFEVLITADAGPIDTYDLRIEVMAVPLGAKTFARVRFTYRYRWLTRMTSALYFASVGRNKVGFSIVGADDGGNPIYVKGRVGATERTVMRYYLGLQTLLESEAQPEAERFEWRLRRWYALSDQYRRQLYELDEDEYLQAKRRERTVLQPRQPELWPQKEEPRS